MITVAIARGRILEEASILFKKAGLIKGEFPPDSRKLIRDFPEDGLRILIVRPTDVPSYVDYGAADCGIVGKDTLLESKHDLYEPLDLGIGRCKLVVAAPRGFDLALSSAVRVATKYPKIAGEYFAKRGLTAEIVKLYGSVELAPLVGLSDIIVDLSASGETLRKNGLVELEVIAEITSRLIVNRVSMKVKTKELRDLIDRLKAVRPVETRA